MKYVQCAFCGKRISEEEIKEGNTVVMCFDNFLQAKYFDENKDNIFCSNDCACNALMIDEIWNPAVIPADCWEEGDE